MKDARGEVSRLWEGQDDMRLEGQLSAGSEDAGWTIAGIDGRTGKVRKQYPFAITAIGFGFCWGAGRMSWRRAREERRAR